MRIILSDPVDPAVKNHFESLDRFTVEEVFERSSLEKEIGDAYFLVVRSGTTVDRDLIDLAPKLIGIVRAGVGLDNIDLEYADRNGIIVENTPEASSNAVAELVIGLILSLFRSIPRADASLKEGDWIKSDLCGREIKGETVGIIGYGRIGRRVGQLIRAFETIPLAYDAYLDDDEIRSHGGEPVSLDELLEKAGVVTVHTPLTEETEHLIGEEELLRLRSDAVLINCSRGGIYDEEALEEALEADRIEGVGLDTFETEPPADSLLVRNENFVGTPHIGAATDEAQERIGQLVIDKIESLARESIS